ncbi:Hypothetical_protein [Hexamita inflata]|uniref:Hypothetical_protein n=1 Tax=Hexamita inflata TaxID=28002 RepID=A0ABP1L0Z0_9EUKA
MNSNPVTQDDRARAINLYFDPEMQCSIKFIADTLQRAPATIKYIIEQHKQHCLKNKIELVIPPIQKGGRPPVVINAQIIDIIDRVKFMYGSPGYKDTYHYYQEIQRLVHLPKNHEDLAVLELDFINELQQFYYCPNISQLQVFMVFKQLKLLAYEYEHKEPVFHKNGLQCCSGHGSHRFALYHSTLSRNTKIHQLQRELLKDTIICTHIKVCCSMDLNNLLELTWIWKDGYQEHSQHWFQDTILVIKKTQDKHSNPIDILMIPKSEKQCLSYLLTDKLIIQINQICQLYLR